MHLLFSWSSIPTPLAFTVFPPHSALLPSSGHPLFSDLPPYLSLFTSLRLSSLVPLPHSQPSYLIPSLLIPPFPEPLTLFLFQAFLSLLARFIFRFSFLSSFCSLLDYHLDLPIPTSALTPPILPFPRTCSLLSILSLLTTLLTPSFSLFHLLAPTSLHLPSSICLTDSSSFSPLLSSS